MRSGAVGERSCESGDVGLPLRGRSQVTEATSGASDAACCPQFSHDVEVLTVDDPRDNYVFPHMP
jgi:hypothetical protein